MFKFFSFKTKWRENLQKVEVTIDGPNRQVENILVTTSKEAYIGDMLPKEKRTSMHRLHLNGNQSDIVRVTQLDTDDCFQDISQIRLGKKRKILLFSKKIGQL